MHITIIILNWNGLDDTIECVDSVLAQTYTDFELHLIDNGSDGDDIDRLASRYGPDDRVTMIGYAHNEGFVGGMNRALEDILGDNRSDYVVLLNNDTVVLEDWLAALVDAAQMTQAGIIASRMINYYRRDELDNAGHIWLNTGEILPRGTGQSPALFGQIEKLVGACAGAAMYSLSMLREIGLFDTYFHTGYEDAEHGLRAYLAGYPTVYWPDAVVYHKVSRSVDKVRDLAYAIRIQKNIYYTVIKLMPTTVLAVNAPFMLIKSVGVLITALLFFRWRLFKAHWLALLGSLRDLPLALRARGHAARLRRLSGWHVLRCQKFFVVPYLRYFRDYMLTGKKTIFER